MPEAKPRPANFPEREITVILGPNINQVAHKSLGRFPIGTYEMSFAQQEKGKQTADAAKLALTTLLKGKGATIAVEESRDYVFVMSAVAPEYTWKLWVTPPFELTQSAHVLWVKYTEDGKTGIAFRLNNAFSVDDVLGVFKTAQKNAVALGAGEAFILKGNPPPRFLKKGAAVETPAAAEAASEAPAAG
jgi:hypothetical protein